MVERVRASTTDWEQRLSYNAPPFDTPDKKIELKVVMDQSVYVRSAITGLTVEGLLGQLKEGGRLVGVSAESKPPRAMIVTHTHGEFGHRALFDAAAPVLPGLERAAAFVF